MLADKIKPLRNQYTHVFDGLPWSLIVPANREGCVRDKTDTGQGPAGRAPFDHRHRSDRRQKGRQECLPTFRQAVHVDTGQKPPECRARCPKSIFPANRPPRSGKPVQIRAAPGRPGRPGRQGRPGGPPQAGWSAAAAPLSASNQACDRLGISVQRSRPTAPGRRGRQISGEGGRTEGGCGSGYIESRRTENEEIGLECFNHGMHYEHLRPHRTLNTE